MSFRCLALTVALAIPGSSALLVERKLETFNATASALLKSNETHDAAANATAAALLESNGTRAAAETADKAANATAALLEANGTHAKREASCGEDDQLSIKEKLETFNKTVTALLDAQEADVVKVLLRQANKKVTGCGMEVRGLMSAKAYDEKFEDCLGSTMTVSAGCSQCLAGQVRNAFMGIGLCMAQCVPTALSFFFAGGQKLGAKSVAAEAKCLHCVLPNFAKLSQCTGRDEDENANKFKHMIHTLTKSGESSAVDLVVSFVETSLDTL